MGTSPSKASSSDDLAERLRIAEEKLADANATLTRIVIELKEMNGR